MTLTLRLSCLRGRLDVFDFLLLRGDLKGLSHLSSSLDISCFLGDDLKNRGRGGCSAIHGVDMSLRLQLQWCWREY